MLCPKGQEVFIRNKYDPVVFSKIVVGICNFFAVVIFILNLTRLFWKNLVVSMSMSISCEFNFPPLSSGGSQIS